MRPNTLADAVEMIATGSAQDVILAEFVDTFDLAKTNQDRYASIEREPKLTGNQRLDALVGQLPSISPSSDGLVACRIGSAIRRAACPRRGSQSLIRRMPCANI
jgi:hypothetical protein